MIEQIHLPQCASTQKTLKELFNARSTPESTLLISTEKQLHGIGRRGNIWDYLENSLAFSFNLLANDNFLITPLEIAVLLKLFFKKKFNQNIKYKWPNDLIINEGKCGGILCQSDDLKQCFIGIGINAKENNSSKYKIGAKSLNIKPDSQKELPFEIVKFIKSNRLTSELVRKLWLEDCYHKDRTVKIVEDETIECTGKFISIGTNGEAIIQKEEKNIEILSGSLFLI